MYCMNITELTKLELERQKNTLNLIASENYPSLQVLGLLGSVWSNKYGEGYPGKRYYAGNQYTDELENYTKILALKVFDTTNDYDVNVQVLSGSPANLTIFLSILDPGDTVLSLSLDQGGHLSHMHGTNPLLKFFKVEHYCVKEVGENNFEIDLEDYEAKLQSVKPKLVIIGFSAYPKKYEFAQMNRLAHENGALVLADIAHINGLVAANLHDSPFKSGVEGSDFVTMTTHKTLRGPRGAMVFAKKEFISGINKTLFPGINGGPHFHQMAATARCLEEILGIEQYPDNIDFMSYSKQVMENTSSFEQGLRDNGMMIISPTQNHLCLVKLPTELDSLELQNKLESQGIICNRNSLPFDSRSPWRPSGLRFGLAALTSRGISKENSYLLGADVARYILNNTPIAISTYLDQLSWHY
jgi:glycine hydroxymethyltransferase